MSERKKLLQRRTEILLEEDVAALRHGLGANLVAVILFGSQARGEAGEDSDWDLLVIARSLPTRPLERHLFLKKMLSIPRRGGLSIVAKTPAEFEASVPPLLLDIALDGIILYDPHGYAQQCLDSLRRLISDKGLHREQSGKEFVWQWAEFPGFAWSIDWEEK